MTTTTVFGDTADAEIVSFDATYSNARDHLASDEGINSAQLNNSAGQVNGGGTYYCIEFLIQFDTSSIPDTDVVSAAVLSMSGLNDNDQTNVNAVSARSYDWGGTAETSDFRTAAQLTALTQVATAAAAAYVTGYIDFTSTGSMPAAINKTGFTRLVLHGDKHAAGTAPATDTEEYWQMNSADVTGTTDDPKLVVTHAAAPSGQPTAKRFGGVQFAGVNSPGNLVRRW